jgi:hypothetical protein
LTDIVVQHKAVAEIVKEVLAGDVFSRNCDMWLLLQVWKRQGLAVNFSWDEFQNAISAETIRRCRQSIQNSQGLFPPTDAKVAIQRRINEDSLRAFYGSEGAFWDDYVGLKYGIK